MQNGSKRRGALEIAVASLIAAMAAPAMAQTSSDVRGGVEAWSRGEYDKAVAAWRPAALAGDADAQFNLAQAYMLGRGVARDVVVAERWFRKAALQGHLAAEAKYGLVLFDQGKRGDAAPWLEKAAMHGEPRAQLVFGTMLFNGDEVAKDWPRAYALIVRAAAANVARASAVQAQMDAKIPTDQRQRGLVLARQYEAAAQRPPLPPDIAGAGDRAASAPRPDASGAKPPVAATKASAPAPAPAAVAGGGWRVQLGAFGDPANARGLWNRIGGKFPGATVRYAKAGGLTRVLVGPYASKGAAAAACGSVKPCVAVGE